MTDHAQTELANLSVATLAPNDLIAPNFHLYELTRSELAARLGVENNFASDRELRAAVHLAREVLQRLRDEFGAFTPNSVYRSQALERRLKNKPSGGLSPSQHTQGCACDVEIVGKSTLELAQWAATNLPDFDQIICECFDPAQGPNSGWVHISLKPPAGGPNRRKTLSYIRDPAAGQMVYVDGLRASVG